MKFIKKIIILLIIFCVSLPFMTSNIIAVSQPNWDNSSYYGGGNPLNANYKYQCTWYVWGRTKELTGISLSARTSEYVYSSVTGGYSSSPSTNSIAVYFNNSGQITHVAYIESYDGYNVTYSEGNNTYYGVGPQKYYSTTRDIYSFERDTIHYSNSSYVKYVPLKHNIQKPNAPSNLSISTNMTNITANWQPSSSATTYTVKIYNHYTCSGNDIVFNRDVGNVTSASFKLNPGHYWGFVHAWNEAGQSEGSNCVEFEVVDKISSPIPAAVKGYSGLYNGKSHTISISNLPEGSTAYYRTNTNASWSRTKPARTSAGTTTVYYLSLIHI